MTGRGLSFSSSSFDLRLVGRRFDADRDAVAERDADADRGLSTTALAASFAGVVLGG
jgi:hypothetical protein